MKKTTISVVSILVGVSFLFPVLVLAQDNPDNSQAQSDIQKQIDALQAQLQIMQQQQQNNSQSTNSPADNSSVNNQSTDNSNTSSGDQQPSIFQFETNIYQGVKGVGDVKNLQDFLKDQGYMSTEIGTTGNFGPLTVAALKKFQAEKKLTKTGDLDETTRGALNQVFMDLANGVQSTPANNTQNTPSTQPFQHSSIGVTYPRASAAGGPQSTTWQTGQTYQIKWTSSGMQSSKIYIYLVTPSDTMAGGSFANIVTTIATGIANTGVYSWTVPQDVSPASNYMIMVSDEGMQTLDKSDMFTIVSSTTSNTNTIGDVNGDGVINVQDALLAYKVATGSGFLTSDGTKRADVNQNGKVTKRDAYIIMDYYVGYISSLPVDASYIPSCGSTTCVYDENEAAKRQDEGTTPAKTTTNPTDKSIYFNSGTNNTSPATSLQTTSPTLVVQLDASTPISTNVSPGQTGITFAKIKLSAADMDFTIRDGFYIASDSVSSGSFSNISIYDGATLVGHSPRLSDTTYGYNRGTVVLYKDIIVPKNGTKVLTLVSDITSSASGTLRLGISDFGYSGVIGLPVYGTNMVVKTSPVSPASVTIVYPSGGEVLKTGSDVNIKWSGQNWPKGKFLAELYRDDGQFVQTITSSLLLDTGGTVTEGRVAWNVTNGLSNTIGPHFKVKVTIYDASGNTITSGDSNIFSIYSAYTPVPTINLSADSTNITAGQSTKIYWTATNAGSGCVDWNGATYGVNNTAGVTVTPTDTQTYPITCQGDGGLASASITITVNKPITNTIKPTTGTQIAPSVTSFEVYPSSFYKGQKVTVSWQASNTYPDSAGSCVGSFASNGAEQLPSQGSRDIYPSGTTDYTLICSGPGGTTPPSKVTATLTSQTMAPAKLVVHGPIKLTWIAISGQTTDFYADVTNEGGSASDASSPAWFFLDFSPIGDQISIPSLAQGQTQSVQSAVQWKETTGTHTVSLCTTAGCVNTTFTVSANGSYLFKENGNSYASILGSLANKVDSLSAKIKAKLKQLKK